MIRTGQQTILVMGMHRSGTSAMAGALVKAGLCAGDESGLYPADENNQKGFYEQRSLVGINELILVRKFLQLFPDLHEYGCSAGEDDLGGLGWLAGAWAEDLVQPMADALIQSGMKKFLQSLWSDNPDYPAFVIKDPRMSLTLPGWETCLKDPLVLIMLRHPAAVARSLWKRDRIHPGYACQLWAGYTGAALKNTRHLRRYLVDYDQFISTPGASLQSIFSWLGSNGVDLSSQGLEEAVRFVSPELRHHQPEADESVPSAILMMYQNLQRHARQGLEVDLPVTSTVAEDCRLQTLLYLVARRNLRDTRAKLEPRLLEAERVHQRILKHPVAGTVIRMLAKIKDDKTFGHLDYYQLPENTDTSNEK